MKGEVEGGISKMRRARDERRRKGEGRIRERRKEKDDESSVFPPAKRVCLYPSRCAYVIRLKLVIS